MDEERFIERVYSNSVLKKAVEEMCEGTGALNLVDPEWKNLLQNNELYQKYRARKIKFSKGKTSKQEKIHVRNVIGMNNCFNVVVVGYWTLDCTKEKADTSFICRLCSPLTEIGNCMSEHDHMKYSDNCRLFVEKCDPGFCVSCKNAAKKLQVFDPKNDWCIVKTKVFNGACIKHVFKTSVEHVFGAGCCMGIFNVLITSRYTYGEENYKIGGTIRDMILFKESSLNEVMNLDIEYPTELPIPQITYPSEEVEESDVELCIPKKMKMLN